MTKHEEMRRQLWTDVAANVAGSLGCKTMYIATTWADSALDEFDKKFKEPAEPATPYKLNVHRGDK